MVYGRHDIWKLDPEGKNKPENITKGYGLRNDVKFRVLKFDMGSVFDLQTIEENKVYTLTAFNNRSKENGFFSLVLKKNKYQFKESMMEQRLFYQTTRIDLAGNQRANLPPVKSREASVYILTRMSEKEFPNYYVTRDFVNLKPLTSYQPQLKYNWLTSELINWRINKEKTGTGILYKPENFDPAKKYPIIFYYYEQNSFALHDYLYPDLNQGQLNISHMVSNGYLVFVPDIHYEIGHPGESAFETINSAADHMAKQPYTDSTKMGLQGHSFGGFETNYIVTRTSRFAAAAPAEGPTDFIAAYGQLGAGYFEHGQGRIGKSLWEDQSAYIENSPVLKADKVTTPMLIMQNTDDTLVPYAQGQAFFNALKRLGKKVWMLDYKGEGHSLNKTENQLDYSVRSQQFFDHYLKGKPAPVWMTGQGNNYDLDLVNQP